MITRRTFKDFIFNNWGWLILAIVLIFVFFIRLHFLNIPLERDEGEYAYAGQLILHGISPYELAYTMKLPGTASFYALVMFLFGQTDKAIHFGLLLINVLSSILIYLFFSKIINRFVGLLTSSFFALLSLSFVFLGAAFHATHLVLFFSLLGFFILTLRPPKWYIYFSSGVCFFCAVFMKQSGVFFIFPALFFLFFFFEKSNLKNYFQLFFKSLSFFILGILFPTIIFIASLFFSGMFSKFWFWSVINTKEYISQAPLPIIFNLFLIKAGSIIRIGGLYPIIFVMLLGIFIFIFSKKIEGLKDKKLFLTIFFLASFLTILPGFYFRQHYFITFLPAISLFIAVFFQWLLLYYKKKAITMILICAIFIPFFIKHFDYFFVKTSSEIIGLAYQNMPFFEARGIALFIKDQVKSEDKIFVFGSEPEIYFYSNKLSATGYIYMYPLMEKKSNSLIMQKEMAREVEESKPEFIVLATGSDSWARDKDSEEFIFSWFSNFLSGKYRIVGIIDTKMKNSIFYSENENTGEQDTLVSGFFLYKKINED